MARLTPVLSVPNWMSHVTNRKRCVSWILGNFLSIALLLLLLAFNPLWGDMPSCLSSVIWLTV